MVGKDQNGQIRSDQKILNRQTKHIEKGQDIPFNADQNCLNSQSKIVKKDQNGQNCTDQKV